MSYATLRHETAVRRFRSLQERRDLMLINMKQLQEQIVSIESEMRMATMEKYLLEKEIEDENENERTN